MTSHRNVIANTLQLSAFEKSYRLSFDRASYSEVTLGPLPQSHIYALVVINHSGPYRGDQIIILPKFGLKSYLTSTEKFKISCLMLVSIVPITSYIKFHVTNCIIGSTDHYQHAAHAR